MDDVILTADRAQAPDELRRDHRSGDLSQLLGAQDTRMLGEDDILCIAIPRDTEHIGGEASFG